MKLNNEDTQDETNQNTWNEKIRLHNEKEKNKDKRFLKLGGENDEAVAETQDGKNKIRKSCRDLEGKKHYEKDFENNLDKSIFWCAEAKKEST